MTDNARYMMTVLGPVPVEDAGVTLTHEHLFIDMSIYWQRPQEMTQRKFAEEPVSMDNLGAIRRNPLINLDNCRLDDISLAVSEVGEFSALGGGTIVEVTPPDVGRDLEALQRAARLTGVNIVAGCGHYVHLAHPTSLADESVEAVADRFIQELTEGVGPKGIRPGVIGEIGTSDPIRPNEEKVLRAAAIAQRETGVCLSLHLHPGTRSGMEVFRILDEAGADPARTIMGHVDIALGHLDMDVKEAVKYHRSLADLGCFIQYDTIGNDAYFEGAGYGDSFWCPSDRVRAEAIARLVDEGYVDHLLLSQDVCHKYHMTRYGGFGYGHILRSFTGNLRDYRVTTEAIQQMLVTNPARAISIAADRV